ncbi:hypothetical protein E2C01_063308 [Portunus trituberculatus]|uniref:Uncharacterized protein n=1 Tax=Portunus trituberculatus TaxID=210409 RepID=A0A5B7HG00_PORTR|nr:hypothetical protein [Portunus trituberculatus]
MIQRRVETKKERVGGTTTSCNVLVAAVVVLVVVVLVEVVVVLWVGWSECTEAIEEARSTRWAVSGGDPVVQGGKSTGVKITGL